MTTNLHRRFWDSIPRRILKWGAVAAALAAIFALGGAVSGYRPVTQNEYKACITLLQTRDSLLFACDESKGRVIDSLKIQLSVIDKTTTETNKNVMAIYNMLIRGAAK
jgi:hypothetical protein